MLILSVLTLIVTGLLVGGEFSIAALVHPTLTRLPDAAHFAASRALAKLLGRVMPPWYALATLLTATLAIVERRQTGVWPPLLLAAAVLLVASIVFSVTALVPVNNKIAAWTDETRLATFMQLRASWDSLHRWRVLLLLAALALLTAGVLSQHASWPV